MTFSPEHGWRKDVRYVGGGSDEKKAEHYKKLSETFRGKKPDLVSEQDWETAQRENKEKTPIERAAIHFANLITNETRQKYELEPFIIPEQNFLILPDNAYTPLAGGIEDEEFEVATSDTEHQRMYLREKVMRLFLLHAAQTILHEMVHHKGALSFEVGTETIVEEGQTKEAIPRREGLTAYIHSSKKVEGREHHGWLLGIDEAIVENYVIRRTPKLLGIEGLQSEKEWLYSEKAVKLKAEIAKKEKIPIDEIAWVAENGKWRPYSYMPQRIVLRYCAEEITKEFPEKFLTIENAVDRFEEAIFISKRMVSLGRLVEQTFGRGSFRMLAEMDDERVEEGGNAKIILEKLHAMRKEKRNDKSASVKIS